MWIKEKFFKYATGTIAVLLIIFLFSKMDFVFIPVFRFMSILFIPILISGLLYYIFRPIVRVAEKIHINKVLAIAAVFVIFIGIIFLIGSYAGSLIGNQFNQLIIDSPKILQAGIDKITQLFIDFNLGASINTTIEDQITGALKNTFLIISGGIVGTISTVSTIVTTALMVPFILFYLLKDDSLISGKIIDFIPEIYRKSAEEIMEETDKTISVYIVGQAIIALLVGLFMYLGYLITGIPYPLILGLFALVTSIIPLIGSVIGAIPAILVALATNPIMAIKVIMLVVIVQVLTSNVISPYLIGKSLDIHPLTVILLFLVAASIYGFIGMLIVVPVYAVFKILAKNGLRIYRITKTKKFEV